MLFHIDNNLIFNFSPSNISSSSLSLKSLYSLDFCLIAFLNRPELELALPGEPAAMLEFCFGVFLGLYARASLSPMNQGTVHRNTKQQQAAHVFFLSPCSPLKQKKEKKKTPDRRLLGSWLAPRRRGSSGYEARGGRVL